MGEEHGLELAELQENKTKIELENKLEAESYKLEDEIKTWYSNQRCQHEEIVGWDSSARWASS